MAALLNLPVLHFWDVTTSAYCKIAIIYNRGANYGQEDVVWHAWLEICDLYFPKVAVTANGPRWSIDREAYRGYPPLGPSQTKPDLIAVKLIPTFPGQPYLLPHISSRDFLWIECKSSVEDTPSGWKNALAEAATRLDTAHSTRIVYLIIAIGCKCAYFVWDPINIIQGPQIYIRPINNGQPWLVDVRIRGLANSGWLNTISGQFNPTEAIELECFSIIIQNGRPVLANQLNLHSIEQFLMHVQNSALQGLNPAVF